MISARPAAFKSAQVIHIQPLAPAKPRLGEACNGCGVCCLVAPCPLGIVLSRRLRGSCVALRWEEPLGMYRCGALRPPERASLLTRALVRLARRWIAAGQGCDSSLEVRAVRDITDNSPPPPANAHD
jgi:MinD superfamily P-loop ATPase